MAEVTALAPAAPRGRSLDRAFLPAELELLETPPSPTLRATAWTLIALVAGTVAWACGSEIEIVATAPGRLVPVGEVKVVQPLETSVVRGIHVAEGDHVAAGQRLIDLDPTEVSADLEATRTERMQALLDAEAARLLLSEAEDPVIPRLPEVDEALQGATQVQLRLQVAAHRATMGALRSEIADKQAALASKRVEESRNAELVPLAEDRFATQKDLFARGNTSKLTLLQAEVDLIDKRADARALPEQARQLQAEIAGLEQKLAQARADFLKEAAEQRVTALRKVAVADQTLRKEREREAERHLTAPVSGTIQDLKVHTLGGVVSAAETLLTLVPDDMPLEVEASVAHREMGFVREGQRAEVKLEAFPFTRYGTVGGTVRLVGREASAQGGAMPTRPGEEPRGSGAGEESAYRVRVSLDRASVPTEGGAVALRSGMAVQADIMTGRRRVIAFLVDPVLAGWKEFGHER
ncbi:type I secretion membrane fusion protein, HlyD family [Methylobacterium sp. 4-46]|uniref:HlyD family type I secretion periplasmic adaptor subunit n=1 Tax=unclassified Methylobacterium TaxID=2615210 RepID=UPI000152D2A5|nr:MULTISPECIES: HlyD family type I secretion periplasmic adaptor subunit [Methylobacterium]ACA20921.1 type I secretion membrane fusion protein, HlyD family [Methylobacterium sp. 4-46]WFT80074.1 HlyD family type I secretion periplasmic adaptor subunit [Methylobacterium nodulans]